MTRNEGEDATGAAHTFKNIVIHGKAQLGNAYYYGSHEGSSRGVDACLKALFLTDPVVDRETLKSEKGVRTSGTCQWIRDNDAYMAWLARDNGPLWISGGPGKGKTMLSMWLTEELETHTREMENAELLFYFCTHQDEKRNDAAAVLRSLAYQLLSKRKQLFPHISSYFESDKRIETTMSSAETLWIVLRTLVEAPGAGVVFCLLDGLDECDDASQRFLISKFRDFFSANASGPANTHLNLAVVSRPMAGLDRFAQVRLDPDNDEYVDNDIRQFISSSVGALHAPGFNQELQEQVEESLLRRAQGTFLWVGFVMHELSRKATCTEIMETVDALPSELPGMYSRMLRQVDEGRRSEASKILRWVTLSVRPLTEDVIAAAIELQPAPSLSIDQTIHDCIALCGPILTVTDRVVTLVHQSARDYLLRTQVDDDPILEEFRIDEKKGHADLTTTCFACVERSPLGEEQASTSEFLTAMRERPMLAYALHTWTVHARLAYTCLDWRVLLKRDFFRKLPIAQANWNKNCPHSLLHDERPTWSRAIWYEIYPPLLHLACLWDLPELVRHLLSKRRYSLGFRRLAVQKDAWGETALFYAVCWSGEAVVRLLLKHGAKINAKNRNGETPIMIATIYRKLGMIQLLHQQGAQIDRQNALHLIPKPWEAGVIETMKVLIDCGADVNGMNSIGQTALVIAIVLKKDITLVRFLLAHGANVTMERGCPETPLRRAIRADNEDLVRVLLDHGADVNEEYIYFGSALVESASEGGEAITRMLLEKGAKVGYHAALLTAISRGRTKTAHLLLEWGADPGAFAHDPCMLFEAAKRGDEELVKLFIERGADVNATHGGRTPLRVARSEGNAQVVRLLESAGACADDGSGNSDDSDSFEEVRRQVRALGLRRATFRVLV